MFIGGVKIEHIDNLDIAKQALTLMDKENGRLIHNLQKALEEIAELKNTDDASGQLAQQLLKLQEQTSALKNTVFGSSSERREGEEPRPERLKPERKSQAQQIDLPVVTKTHKLHEEDTACTCCGGELEEWSGQYEEFEEIDVIHRTFQVVKHKRQKYRCECGASPVTAPGPVRLRGSKFSLLLAVEVVVNKWAEHLPLTRQKEQMALEGLGLSDAQLWQMSEQLARVFQGSYDALGKKIAMSELLHADETTWPMLRKGNKKWWMWTFSNYDSVYIHIDPSRSHEVPKRILEHSNAVLVADGYSAYSKLTTLFPDISLALCWSHARRKFIEAEKSYPEVSEVIDLMRELFMLEREMPDFRFIQDKQDRADALKLILDTRTKHSQPIVDQIKAWLEKQRHLPGSAMAKAIRYLSGNWSFFVKFLLDARIPLTNNQAERTLRAAVVGRKNHYGSKSERGTEVAAIFYSLLGTCRMLGVNPRKYLEAAAIVALETPGEVLLPADFLALQG